MNFIPMLLLITTVLAQAAHAGDLRVVIERDSWDGIEQASVHFSGEAVEVYTNTNFAANDKGESFLGHFRLPYDQRLRALKEMLGNEVRIQETQNEAFRRLQISPEGAPDTHGMKVYLGKERAYGDARWGERVLAVLSFLREGHSVHGARALKSPGKGWEVTDLQAKKQIDVSNCRSKHCLVEGFGKLVD